MSLEALHRLRWAGWRVAVHNDYRLDGKDHTFWLFTKGYLAAKGEGLTDAEALQEVEREVERIAEDRRALKGAPRNEAD